MAFDNATRNRLSKFVAVCRERLVKEFKSQLTRDFGLDPDTGDVTDIDSLNLNNVTYATAIVLRETMQHYMAVSTAKKKDAPREALQRIVREQSFTVLNRLCALRMAERRDLFIESVGKGIQSDGFQLYSRVAGTSLGPTGDTYQAYLLSVFDELAIDLPVLFDRFSAQGRLFPRDTVLQELLEELNHAEIEHLWEEDETIGWIYQYFNDPAERKAMRDASQAPRNSRELAVRNQFFTPRYVVEFLTDNTLGRIWYEMRKGETRLVDECQYLVRRPNEIFDGVVGGQGSVVSEDNESPHTDHRQLTTDPNTDHRPLTTDLTQEELLNQPVHIPHRPLKDPREIRMLDPACGSMHFGLYAFDLYLKIYEEAWDSQLAVVGGQWSGDINEQAAILSRLASVAESDGSRGPDLSGNQAVPEGRTVRHDESTASGGGLDSVEHRGGAGPDLDEGVSPSSIDRVRLADGSGNADLDREASELLAGLTSRQLDPESERDRQDVEWAFQFAVAKVISGQGSVVSEENLTTDHRPPTTLTPLLLAYPNRDDFLKQVPKLIIENNIHGIDIDPRAVQIAGLSLWLRAQRAWKSQGIAAEKRPQVTRSNIVCAEPMPGDPQQLEAFCQELHPAIAQMVTAIFEEMRLAGEAGSLLKIEQEIKTLVSRAKEQWQQQPKETQLELFGGAAVVKEQQLEFDLSGITDQHFFEQAEETIYEALRKYASETSEGGFRRKLFAGDAEKGFALFHTVRRKYDLCLMNPPYGDLSKQSEKYIKEHYKDTWKDIYACFIERLDSLVCDTGFIGALTSNTFFHRKQLTSIRELLVGPLALSHCLQLGIGVLDDAAVEVAAYVLSARTRKDHVCVYWDYTDVTITGAPPVETFHFKHEQCIARLVQMRKFRHLDRNRFAFWMPDSILKLWRQSTRFEPTFGEVVVGLTTFDNDRFFRLAWETPAPLRYLRWFPIVKGGEYAPYLRDEAVLADWEAQGRMMQAFELFKYNTTARTTQSKSYFLRRGLTFPRVGKSFGPRVLPEKHLLESKGTCIFLNETTDDSQFGWLAFLNTPIVESLLQAFGRNRFWETAAVANLPLTHNIQSGIARLSELGRTLASICHQRESHRETSGYFVSPRRLSDATDTTKRLELEANNIAMQLLGIGEVDAKLLSAKSSNSPNEDLGNSSNLHVESDAKCFLSYAIGVAFGRWDYRKALQTSSTKDRNLFEAIAAHVPGELTDENSSPISNAVSLPRDYGVIPDFSGILSEQTGDDKDLVSLVRKAIELIWLESCETIESEISRAFRVDHLLEAIVRPSAFFEYHLAAYSKSRRSAPIYWPISTESGSYTLWFYYHRLTDQTLYKAVNDFVDPKLKQTLRQLADLRAIKDRSSAQEKELAQLTELESELEQFKADLLETAAFWKPNLNDGVQITAAPLWKFFRLTKWRNKLRRTWEDLESGKYDWAHLALSIWPDRVVKEKCTTDRSIAIAHDLEQQLWHEVEVTKTTKSGKKSTKTEWQPKNLSERQLSEIVDEVKAR